MFKSFATVNKYITEIDRKQLMLYGKKYLFHSIDTSIQNVFDFWKPTILAIDLTYACTRQCKDCYVENKPDIISEDLLQIIMKEASAKRIQIIGLIGGEPIQKNTISLVKKVTRENPTIGFSAYTNGDYIASSGLSDLCINNLCFTVSIDGFENTHNSIRGNNSYKNVLKSFDECYANRRLFGAALTIRPENIYEVSKPEFLEMLSDHHVKYISIMKLKGTDERNLDTKDFFNSIKIIKKNSKRYSFLTIFGSLDEKKAISNILQYRQLFIDINGNTRISKLFSNNLRNNIKSGLDNIIYEVNNLS